MGRRRGRRISIDEKKQVEPVLDEIFSSFDILTLLEWLMQG